MKPVAFLLRRETQQKEQTSRIKAVCDALQREPEKCCTSVNETLAESQCVILPTDGKRECEGQRRGCPYLVDGLLALFVLLGLFLHLLALLYVVDEREEVAQVDDERLRLG